ncbi:ATP-grasp domain-containing protein [Actinokineospora spheciospongiae]|uniref:ATP-grasp domain-containing protein n=1 Tax=Actinokineospora spheciospongiae TaxID=909613 RepID=UPI000D70BA76|nr:ATP-grasp domain-containing protein [Actinokineospora spheciospongiae]PWW66671.1 biotin carboxylase [Actinokineospora spheciospongiae]
MKSLVILGGADGAVGTYHRARELGYRTICVDFRAAAPAVAVADEFVQVSVRAPEQIAAALAGRGDIVGVLCPASDVGLATQAALIEHWDLARRLPDAAVSASMDKSVFRFLCDSLDLPSYASVAGAPGPDLVAAARRLRFPALVKPVDSSGSRGVVACATPGRLAEAFTEAIAFSPSGRVVVEEFLDGTHLTVEALVVDGQIAFHAVTSRTVTPPPFFVTTAHVMPADLPEHTDAHLVRMLTRISAELGYTHGPLTLDAVLGRDGELYLIEMAARLGGNGLSELVQAATGVDLVGAMIDLATGGTPVLSPRPIRPSLVHMLASDRAGHLVRVEGVTAVAEMPEVVRLYLFAEEGTHVHAYEQAGYKLGYLVLSADTPWELWRAEGAARAGLRFVLDAPDMAVPLP